MLDGWHAGMCYNVVSQSAGHASWFQSASVCSQIENKPIENLNVVFCVSSVYLP